MYCTERNTKNSCQSVGKYNNIIITGNKESSVHTPVATATSETCFSTGILPTKTLEQMPCSLPGDNNSNKI